MMIIATKMNANESVQNEFSRRTALGTIVLFGANVYGN